MNIRFTEILKSSSLFFSISSLLASMPLTTQAQAIEGAPEGYKLIWSDEFNGNTLDEKTWNIEVSGDGGGNQELQYYKRENVSVGNGNLILTARRENYSGRAFTSGRVNTKNNTAFKHGIIQARIKIPKTANGLWPAYWMMGNDMDRYGWPRCGEIDIVEMGHFNAISGDYAGMQDRYFAGTTHYGPDPSNENHQQYSQDYLAPEDNAVENDEYHIFTVEWDDDYLYMYYDLDGYTNAKKRKARYFTQEISYSDAVLAPGHYFQKPFFLLFNLAIGGTYTNIYDPNQITALPNAGDEAKMYVDWVRVYQKEDDENAQYLYYDENGEKQTNIEEEPIIKPDPDEKTELSSFATKALDENGESTFDFADGYDYVLISTSQGVTGNCYSQSNVLKDYNVDQQNNFLYVWDGTYAAQGHSGATNSFGWGEGYTTYYVANMGWSGLGFASPSGQGKDLSMLEDEDYWLHFAMLAGDQERHTSHTILLGKAEFRIGYNDGTHATVGDFKRDGEWYYFDIPVKALHQFANPMYATEGNSTPTNYAGNAFAVMSGGENDAEVNFDNVFFYKSHSKKVPTYTDTVTELGEYGYKSLDENNQPVFNFDEAEDIIPLVLSQDMWEHLTAGGTYDNSLVKEENDYSEQGGRNNFFIWGNPQTFTARSIKMINSFGNEMEVNHFTSTNTPDKWNGMGYASIDGQGNFPKPKDMTKVTDDYYLHFSVRSEAAVGHTPVSIKLGNAELTLGQYANKPTIGDFKRDGEWYSFDIPVAVFKKYAPTLFTPEVGQTLSNFTGYVLCLNTMGTYYSSEWAIDNVFLFKKKGGMDEKDVEPALGKYTTKSLDDSKQSSFDWEGKDFVVVTASAKERLLMGEDNIIADLGIDDQKTHLWLWDGTLASVKHQDGDLNSFGFDEGWSHFKVTNYGWSGSGLVNDDGYDVSMLDDSFTLHFAMRGTQDADMHLIFAATHFNIGKAGYINQDGEVYVQLGNYEKNNEWYSFDIPMSVFRQINPTLFRDGSNRPNCYKNNLFCFDAGGVQGTEIQIDNIFFYRNKPVVDAIEEVEITTPSAQLSQSALGIYDLSGRRVESMNRPGLYIIRTASGVKKVLKK